MNMLKSFGKFPFFLVLAAVLGLQLSAHAAQTAGTQATAELAQAMTVNINTATAGELAVALNGVGEKRALAIVEYREAHGAFKAVDELMAVKGIGEKVLAKNRHLIVLQ